MKPLLAVLAVTLLAQGAGVGPSPMNCPYLDEEEGRNILYRPYTDDPKTLDPAVSYYSYEYEFLAQIYEPPLQYHYLKRPYTLEPLTLSAMPAVRLLGKDGRELPSDAPDDRIDRVVYECRIRPGIRYQNHPCFAKDAGGKPRYVPVDPKTVASLPANPSPEDFPEKSTRELVAEDYVLGIRRLADPRLPCPISETLVKYLVGMNEFSKALDDEIQAERKRRKDAAGAAYNQELDERAAPIRVDFLSHPFPGVEAPDRYTLRLTLTKKYPQIYYWMAMPFFSPVPREAMDFYEQPELIDLSVTLEHFPVGTGPYFLKLFDRKRRVVLERNPNYHDDRYPSEGMPEDRAAGLLEDAGKRLPFSDQLVFTMEKEPTPNWNKFLQGYYDDSGIPDDSFERAVTITPDGATDVSGELKDKGIVLHRSVTSSISYMGFNLRDPVFGGYDEKRCKLRQAVDLAIDTEEKVQIFSNGRGVVAQQPLPDGIFGYEDDQAALDTHTFDWRGGRAERKPLEEAKRLLAESGFPGGIGPDGKQLVLYFDNAWTGSEYQPRLNWHIEKLARIGVRLEPRTSDIGRYRDKLQDGNFQLCSSGWNADYPDPENFLFLFYGPNSHADKKGENSSNYDSPEFNALFHRMENMENTPERMALIRKMRAILQHDAPWVSMFYPVGFALHHQWLRNVKPNLIANNTLKYHRVDVPLRSRLRREWNRPDARPVWMAALACLLLFLPAWLSVRRRERGRA